jgi:hypothetical protein
MLETICCWLASLVKYIALSTYVKLAVLLFAVCFVVEEVLGKYRCGLEVIVKTLAVCAEDIYKQETSFTRYETIRSINSSRALTTHRADKSIFLLSGFCFSSSERDNKFNSREPAACHRAFFIPRDAIELLLF